MELQQFIAESLRQIVTGVADAQKVLAETGGEVAPRSKRGYQEGQGYIEHFDESQPVFRVEFDVAVTASEGSQTKGGIGVVVGFLGVGSQGKTDTTNSSVSRIKFEVPIAYPRGRERPTDPRTSR